MSDSVIDLSERLNRRQSGNTPSRAKNDPAPTPLERLRKMARTNRADQILLAKRLGEVAARISPGRPQDAARPWLGDRWPKRHRFIIFPGEKERGLEEDPYASSGADWARLIEQASLDLHPGDDQTPAAQRARATRDILRGTSFLPDLPPMSVGIDTAQAQLKDWAEKIAEKVANDTSAVKLWERLRTTPFDIIPYRKQREKEYSWQEEDRGYDGDIYSTGPLGEPSRVASALTASAGMKTDHCRFVPSSGAVGSWPYPRFCLGIRARPVAYRIFILPQEFCDQADDDWWAWPDIHPLIEWLVQEGFLPTQNNGKLPDLTRGIDGQWGWQSCKFELCQSVWIEIRPKDGGNGGIWISTMMYVDEEDVFNRLVVPRLEKYDIVSSIAKNQPLSSALWIIELPNVATVRYGTDNNTYALWMNIRLIPEHWTEIVDGNVIIPDFGLLENLDSEFSDIEGWIDDFDNRELQDLLFRNTHGVRFCPSISVAEAVPPPCQQGTVAAAIFANLGCAPADRLSVRLVERAKTIGSAGMAFHDALVSHNRELIEKMFDD